MNSNTAACQGEREMKVTQAQMAEARLDLAYRDYCAHMLIPLNRCRRRTVSSGIKPSARYRI